MRGYLRLLIEANVLVPIDGDGYRIAHFHESNYTLERRYRYEEDRNAKGRERAKRCRRRQTGGVSGENPEKIRDLDPEVLEIADTLSERHAQGTQDVFISSLEVPENKQPVPEHNTASSVPPSVPSKRTEQIKAPQSRAIDPSTSSCSDEEFQAMLRRALARGKADAQEPKHAPVDACSPAVEPSKGLQPAPGVSDIPVYAPARMPDDISPVNYHRCENALQSALGGEPEPNLVDYLFRRTAAIQARDVELGYAAHRLHAARQKGQRINRPYGVTWL